MYTIEQQGNRWVASSGNRHVEGDSPDKALMLLLLDEEAPQSEDEEADDDMLYPLEKAIGNAAIRLIQMLATHAPAEILRGEVKLIGKHIEEYIERLS